MIVVNATAEYPRQKAFGPTTAAATTAAFVVAAAAFIKRIKISLLQ